MMIEIRLAMMMLAPIKLMLVIITGEKEEIYKGYCC